MDERAATLAAAAAGLALVLAGAAAQWRHRRRTRLGAVPLVPWNSLMLIGMIAAVFAAAHLLTLSRAGSGP